MIVGMLVLADGMFGMTDASTTDRPSTHHPVGTCAMGAVVDAHCRVLGVDGLSVVDASVMPKIPPANTNIPTIMIAEQVVASRRAAAAARGGGRAPMTSLPAALQTALRGRVVDPGAPDYDQSRLVWNGAVDRRPALIARCADTDDVLTCVRYAREHGLEIAVRSGGHSVDGESVCDGGLVIDLAGLNGVAVRDGIARAGAGLLNGEFDEAT